MKWNELKWHQKLGCVNVVLSLCLFIISGVIHYTVGETLNESMWRGILIGYNLIIGIWLISLEG